jgi:hypothetical protein
MPACLGAVLLDMDCIAPPPVNPLQRIPHSVAEQGTRQTTALQLSTGLQVGMSHRAHVHVRRAVRTRLARTGCPPFNRMGRCAMPAGAAGPADRSGGCQGL